jgi:hypothetical protein
MFRRSYDLFEYRTRFGVSRSSGAFQQETRPSFDGRNLAARNLARCWHMQVPIGGASVDANRSNLYGKLDTLDVRSVRMAVEF